MLTTDARRLAAAGAVLIACAGGSPTARAQDACSAAASPGEGLEAARALFAERCPAHERRDCDPIDGAWLCSSVVIGDAAPAGTASVDAGAAPPVASPAPVPTTPLAGTRACTATGATLGAAREAFPGACAGAVPVDCDPSGSGWTCSSEVLGAAAPGGRTVPILAAAPTAPPAPATPTAPVPSTPPAPGTPVPPSPAEPPPPAPDPAPSPTPAAPAPVVPEPGPEASPGVPVAASPAVGRLREGDLLVLMYDNCSDPDDGHAAAAAKAAIAGTGAPAPWIVNGTCGANLESQFNTRSRALMDAVWGGSWLDASVDRAGAVSASADAWAAALANGRDVWIAEGGPSDVTAEIVREIGARYPSLDTGRLRVVQHSAWNERHTAPANLAFVRAATDYLKIDDGNFGGNGTADLNPTGGDFDRLTGPFVETAAGGPFAGEWRAAFEYLPPGCPGRTEVCKLDFSDTAELLYILGDETTRDVASFAARYLR